MSRIEQKLQTRQRIVDAAGRSFRKSGFNGVGVDGLAKEAGLTSGAFYVHFGSKADAFCESVVAGMDKLKQGICYFQQEHSSHWWHEFVHFYMEEKRVCDLSEGCALQALVGEVSRSDEPSRLAFERGLEEVAKLVVTTAGIDSPRDIDSAISALATLAGGVTLARAMLNVESSERVARSIEKLLSPQR